MSVQSMVPVSSRFNQVSVSLLSAYNVPTPGVYDFSYFEPFGASLVTPSRIALLGNWPVGTAVSFVASPGATLDSAISPRKIYYIVSSVPSGLGPQYQDVSISEILAGKAIVFAADGSGVSVISPVYQVMNLVQGCLYFLERINVGATVSQEIYLSAISRVPTISLVKQLDGQQIFPHPLPLVNFVNNQECNGYLWTSRALDVLLLSVSGVLSSTIDLVGQSAVTLSVQFNVYEIIDKKFIQGWANGRANR